MDSSSFTGKPLDVVCLCAQWCNNCRAYQPMFDSMQSQFEGTARFSWIDIEDESEVLGDIEVENFPTLLLLQEDVPLFFGPLTPQAGVLAQLVRSALDGRLLPLTEQTVCELAVRVRQNLG